MRAGKRSVAALSYVAMALLAAFMLAPFVWMLLVSLHPPDSPIPPPARLIPASPAWSNYAKVLLAPQLPVARFFANSVFVSGAAVVGQLAICSMAAYAFARLRFAGSRALFNLFLGSMMLGGVATQIPVFLLLRGFGWLDTYAALIVPGLSSAFSIFLLRQAFAAVPRELDEAARLDGAGELRILARVILPLCKASLATCATFTFVAVWTDFFGPLIYTDSTRMRTMEVGLSIFKNSYGGTNWPLQMCAAAVTTAPLLIVFLLGQRHFVRGVVLGSGK